MKIRGFVFGCLMAAVGASAHAATMDFSGLQNGERPELFYAGGAGALGSVGGHDRDFGVTFTNALARCNVTGDCEGATPDILVFTQLATLTASAAPLDFNVNVAGGFTGDFAFDFATTQTGVAELWSGASGTGVLLGTISLGAGGCPVPDGHCSFRNASGTLDMSKVAHSISFTGVNRDFFAIDNLTLNLANSPISAAPEPAAWGLMISGFGLAGAVLRRRRRIAGAWSA